ncbi:lipocalin-like domain-containing protein [Jiangella muralis]|uniref:lipocalin-like domain-containing protein n=1 Tax=Jiangella muralis TaxID=702383 RepID=UPI00069D0BD3|nr:lipocalin-like domain-containing protein [Jiangella muralis]
MTTSRRRVIALGLAATAAPVLGPLDLAPAAASPARPAAQTFPRYVRLPDDQASDPDVGYEWWYVVGHVRAGRRWYGYEVTINRSSAGPEVHAAITDETAGTHRGLVERYEPGEATFSTDVLDVRTPAATLAGPMDDMRLAASLPGARIELTLRHAGPALYPGGTGLIPFADGFSYYYSLPSLATRGTLTVDGHPHRVRGTSWLDRQWGTWHWASIQRWTWMAVHLDNGDRLNVWNLIQDGDDQAYATIVDPDGHHTVASIVPLADHARDFWTSPLTGQTYPTRWRVEIPGRDTRLDIRSLVTEQELDVYYPGQPRGLYEADCAVTGSYAGRRMTGRAYVELYGDWKTPGS